MTIIIPISVFAFIVFGSVALYWVLARPQSAANDRLKQLRFEETGVDDLPTESPVVKIVEKVTEPINRMLPPSAEQASKLQKRLMFAGYRSPNAPVIYRGLQILSLIGFPFLLWTIVMIVTGGKASFLLWLAIGAFLGYVTPRAILDNIVNSRQLRLRWGLADALD